LNDGGQERQLFYLLNELQKLKQYKIILFVWNLDDSDKYYIPLKNAGIEIIGFENKTNFLLKISSIRKYIKERNPVVLQSYTFYLNFFCWLSTLNFNTKPIGGLRSSILKEYEINKINVYLNIFFPKIIVSNNYASQDELKKIKGFRKKKLYIIHNRLDSSSFSTKSTIVDNPIITCSIGRLDQNKRVDKIIDLVETLNQKGYKLIHKHAGEGVLKDHLIDVVKKRGLEKQIMFLGKVADINSFLKTSSFLIHTSATEGMPNVVLEAMASSLAILSTDCGDVSYLVKENKNGFVIPIDDFDSLVSKTKYLMDNPSLLISMGKLSRKIIENSFDIAGLSQETIKLYKNL